MRPLRLRLRLRSLFVFSLQTLDCRAGQNSSVSTKKSADAKRTESFREKQGETEAGEEPLGVEERIGSNDLFAGEFQDNQRPSLMAAFRIGPVLRESGPSAGSSGNQAG